MERNWGLLRYNFSLGDLKREEDKSILFVTVWVKKDGAWRLAFRLVEVAFYL